METPQLQYWLPQSISAYGNEVDKLINVLHYFMALLFIGWGIYLVYCLVKFRERPGHEADIVPKHFTIPSYLEVGVVVVEACLLIFFSSPIWAKVKRDFPSESESLVVRVVAQQFLWNIHYPGKDGKFGTTKIDLIDDASNPVGVDREDPNGKDDIVSTGVLKVPVNKNVIAHVSSKDVIHSFSLPVMRVKIDAVPGIENKTWFNAEKVGDYEIACAQLCGNSHTNMRGDFQVLSQEDFDKWIDEETKNLMGDASSPSSTTGTETNPTPNSGDSTNTNPPLENSAGGNQ